ncbi:tetratricopeptide repeat protein [Aeromicrobium marinum DSM 15272]|uniref:Tetratricopeptide repeat protein n=1 Tax=Aeromicrobium marinum DSM 15272 TaxID=585531 RepID=E2SAF3_9ACTN|nr:tetratricopeptide repeat protein [Aeromicrobium marinum]EFQ84227.1 tetratricopeptide repeat protein [Aeromicrobium marinum DSM 15272]
MTDHTTPDAYDAYRRAEELVASRRPREAVRLLEHVTTASPDHAGAWELLGRAHFAAAHLTLAEDAFRRLVELEPTSAWARTALGLSLDRQSRHAEGATQHRIAGALGASGRDATRVELVGAGPDPTFGGLVLGDRLRGGSS